MNLNPFEPKAHIIVNFDPDRIQNKDLEPSLHYIHQRLTSDLQKYKVYLISNNRDKVVQVFNAHLNYEPVSYEDRCIKYPHLEERIFKIIEKALSDLNTKSLDSLGLAGIKEFNSHPVFYQNLCNAREKVSELNLIKSNPSQRFSLNISDDIEIILQNFKLETLLIADWNTPIPTLKSILQAIEKIQADAFQSGSSSINGSETHTPNAFGSINIPEYLDDIFINNEEIKKYIQFHQAQLMQIDPDRNIKNLEDTLWINFITSFKSGAIDKIRKLVYPGEL